MPCKRVHTLIEVLVVEGHITLEVENFKNVTITPYCSKYFNGHPVFLQFLLLSIDARHGQFLQSKKAWHRIDTLVSYLNEFGLGHPLGTDNVYENDGFIPDSKFYDHLYRREASGWKATYMLSLGIGQGELQLTTVQMANIAAAIANRGYYITPHLVRKFRNSNISIPAKFTEKKMMRIDQKYYNPVVDGMQMAVKAGTATRPFLMILVCGKTGTSQNLLGRTTLYFLVCSKK
ncbi:MAG: hypothetical protein IPN72_02475 [Saprospiraceae bacterium]|nr:hypothetical protein [Saprospiraceae bacterium]